MTSTLHGFERVRTSCVAMLIAGLAPTAAARADVVSSAPDAFTVKHEAVVPLAPQAAYERLLRLADWWDPAHTYSGEATRLTLDAKPGGCWCESLKNGGFVEHMRVVLAWPGTMLRLSGGLGPLQELGASGAMTFALKAEGAGTKVTLTYAVRGAAGTLDKVAGPVDMVLGQAMARYGTVGAKP
jgi:hypothetical protein